MKRVVFPVASMAAVLSAAAIEFAAPQNVPPLFEPGVGAPRDAAVWHDGRRAEIKKIFERQVYGVRPVERPPHLAFSDIEHEREMMEGAALRRRVKIEYGGTYGTNSFPATAFIPKAGKPVPAFILICNRPPEQNIDPERNVKSEFWPAEEIVSRGYAAVTFYIGDVTPDMQHGNTRGAFAAFEDVERKSRPASSWGAISVWAWAASRVLDWLETQSDIDAKHVAVVGHSRGGKTALVAAAWDERFAMACSNDSGCGGAKLNHVDLPGSEKIVNLAISFQFWFCRRFTAWANLDTVAPFDQHMFVALIAPRLVCIGSATEDGWAGPYGEYCTARYASDAWVRVFGMKGFVSTGFPEPNAPQQDGDISYHIRAGGHDLTLYDWKCYLDFADRHGWRSHR